MEEIRKKVMEKEATKQKVIKQEAIKQEFQNPSREYTPLPFWFWNDDLSKEELNRQILEFKEKGVDGFVIHPRMGLPKSIEYLSKTYFDFVTYAVQRAKELDMQVVLYDEAMYPSGSCHGMVVKQNPSYASQGLIMVSEDSKTEIEAGNLERKSKNLPKDLEEKYLIESSIEGLETAAQKKAKVIAKIKRQEQNWYFIQMPTEGTIRGIHYGEDDGEKDAPKSADLLNPDAVACFLNLTHERYYQHLKEYFGTTILSFFTDEPNILGRCAKKGMIPWSDGILEEFLQQGGKTEDLYYLFQEKDSEKGIAIHKIYQKTIYNRLSKSYYKQIADWCEAHKISLTGHPEKSTDIGYLQYFHIPCQDIVWRFVAPEEGRAISGADSTMGKCSSDSARHHGRRRNGNECFGCCSTAENPYQITKEEVKWYLNWLFVRGVNLIYPHAFYYSLREKRKDERPPEVGMHSGFWESYKEITDYIKRMCALLTDTVNQTEIAVLCSEEELSWEAVKPLWQHQIEFNYLEEELLSHCTIQNQALWIAKQHYHIVIRDRIYGEETEKILDKFCKEGGLVLQFCTEQDLLKELQKVFSPDICLKTPESNLRSTHLKKAGQHYFLLTNEGDTIIDNIISFPGGKITEIWNAWSGTIEQLPQPAEEKEFLMPPCESKIFCVSYEK